MNHKLQAFHSAKTFLNPRKQSLDGVLRFYNIKGAFKCCQIPKHRCMDASPGLITRFASFVHSPQLFVKHKLNKEMSYYKKNFRGKIPNAKTKMWIFYGYLLITQRSICPNLDLPENWYQVKSKGKDYSQVWDTKFLTYWGNLIIVNINNIYWCL